MKKLCALLAIATLLFAPPLAKADDHLVSRGAVEARLASVAAERAQNLSSLDRTLSSPRAGQAAAIAGLDLTGLRKGLPSLSDSDLRDLAQRAAALEGDPAAGYHYHDDAVELLVVVMLLAAVAIVVLEVAQHR